jgi:hypothetical protein
VIYLVFAFLQLNCNEISVIVFNQAQHCNTQKKMSTCHVCGGSGKARILSTPDYRDVMELKRYNPYAMPPTYVYKEHYCSVCDGKGVQSHGVANECCRLLILFCEKMCEKMCKRLGKFVYRWVH